MRTATVVSRTLMTGVAASLLMAACARRGHNTEAARPYVPPKVTVTVQNDNWLDIDVFVLAGGNKVRLGHVSSNSQGEWEVPRAALGPGNISILADPIGSNRVFETPIITVVGHTWIDVRVDNIIDHSTYSTGQQETDDS